MPIGLLVIAGYVYENGSTTPIENVIVTVKNLTTNENHNGEETEFPELKTNESGEFIVNLANFDTAWTVGDIIRFTLSHEGKLDLIELTLTGNPVEGIVLTPLREEIYDFERCVDESGSIVKIQRTTIDSYDGDYESVDSSSLTDHPIKDNTYARIEIEEDEEKVEGQGIVKGGIAIGWFKVRYGIRRGDQVNIPEGSSNLWIVQDKPPTLYAFNEPAQDEIRLKRIRS